MFSTDNSAGLLSVETPPISAEIRSPELFVNIAPTTRTIAFVDSRIADFQTVMANIQSDIKVLLDPTKGGIAQITESLSHYQNITGIEIVSHGNSGELQLGNSSINSSYLSQHTTELQQWHNSLASGADILLYGCYVADQDTGKSFVNKLGALTGADVAASTNLTGSATKGGDWQLEYATGQIETISPFTNSLTNSYEEVLQSIFTTQTPDNPNQSDGAGADGDYELGMKFVSSKIGQIDAIRYYKAASEIDVHTGKIWSSTGTLLGSVAFTSETASGWQQQALTTPISIAANTTYVVSVNANSYFAVSGGGIATTITNGDLSAVADGSNGTYNPTPGVLPTTSNNSNYFRDVVFTPTTVNPPTNQIGVVAITGITTQNQSLTANVTDVDGLTGIAINYKWQQSADGSTWTDISGATAKTFTLGQAQIDQRIRVNAAYTDTLGGSENILSTASSPVSATNPNPSILESIFTTQIPDNPNQSDGVGADGDYELGLEFTSAKAGQINAVRYYKAASEIGVHTGKIWSSTGTLLGSVTFANETASGWQQQALTTPISITANSTYVISVNANSHFAVSGNAIVTTITNGDLSAVADGSNGVYNSTVGLFPTASNNSNYFRDIVFSPTTTNPPTNQLGSITTNGNATQNQVLTANVTDADGLTGVNINYKWQQSTNGTNWNNITGATKNTLTLTQAQVNQKIRATATYTDALGNIENLLSVASATTANVNDIGKVILKGSATVGRTLTQTVLDEDGITGSNINYRWQQSTNGTNWSNIAGGTTKSLALTSGLLNRQVRLRASYTDALGAVENVVSTSTRITAQNAIVLENQKTGTTDWQINTTQSNNNEIAGYGDASSINKGQALNLKVSLAQAGKYNLDVYRLGYYGGAGGRLVSNVTGLNGVKQADPTIDPTTRLVEAKWNTSYTLQTGTDWTSGLYLAKLTDSATGKQSYVEFVVRDDNRPAEIGFQDASNTVAAYNNYGGYSSYTFNSINNQAAQKVSFDRPVSAATNGILAWEYQTARWAEAQGYDISYYANSDVQTNPYQLYSQNAFLSVGHDEYWSLDMRNNVEKARDNGTNLAFFSANSAYWRVRYEPSTTGQSNRVLAIYKDNWALDPIAQQDNSQATTRFRSAQVNRPENALLGVMYTGLTNNVTTGYDFVVSNAADPYYAGTGLQNGDKIPGLVGYEWDAVVNNGLTPNGLVVLSESPVIPDGGTASGLPAGTNTNVSNSVRYTAASGAKVFATGSIQWVWGLDSDRAPNPRKSPVAQKIATNVFADLGAIARTPRTI